MSVNSLTRLRLAVNGGQVQHSSVLPQSSSMRHAALLTAIAWLGAAVCACSPADSSGGPEAAGVKATYSKASGRLELITYDTNKDGKVDAWSRMDEPAMTAGPTAASSTARAA